MIDGEVLTDAIKSQISRPFALVVAQKNGRLGPAIQEPDASRCQPLDLSAGPAALALGKAPPLTCGKGFLVTGERLSGAGLTSGSSPNFSVDSWAARRSTRPA
jgi:hypothetical protein